PPSCFSLLRQPLLSTLFPYTTLFRSSCSSSRGRIGVPYSGPPKRLAPRSVRVIIDYPHGEGPWPSAISCASSSSTSSSGPSRRTDRKSTRLNSSHVSSSYAACRLKQK